MFIRLFSLVSNLKRGWNHDSVIDTLKSIILTNATKKELDENNFKYELSSFFEFSEDLSPTRLLGMGFDFNQFSHIYTEEGLERYSPEILLRQKSWSGPDAGRDEFYARQNAKRRHRILLRKSRKDYSGEAKKLSLLGYTLKNLLNEDNVKALKKFGFTVKEFKHIFEERNTEDYAQKLLDAGFEESELISQGIVIPEKPEEIEKIEPEKMRDNKSWIERFIKSIESPERTGRNKKPRAK